MAQLNRVEGYGRIDRKRPIRFRFDGRSYEGFAGDTLASALLANGVKLVGRSLKFHRPRGVYTAGSDEPSALVQLEEGAVTEPNTRATTAELYEGLTAFSQNCWPSVRFDLLRIIGIAPRLIPAGFYNKTFMWPAKWWRSVFEPAIRMVAGLGKCPSGPDPDAYEHRHRHCDVLVVGMGPAGLAAALTAGRTGARVIVVDEHPEPGGSLLWTGGTIDGRRAIDWVARTFEELSGMKEVTLLPRTAASAYYDHNYLTLLERVANHIGPHQGGVRERFWKVRVRQAVLATGAHERSPVFAENDRPGIMTASAMRTYLNRFGVLAGRRIAVFTNNNSAYATALDADGAGAKVTIVDTRAKPSGPSRDAARRVGIPVHAGHGILGTRGRFGITSCEIAPLGADGRPAASGSIKLACDALGVSAGWNPSVHLWSQARGTVYWDNKSACFKPVLCQQRVVSAGSCKGTFDLAGCLKEGSAAGARAAQRAGFGDGRHVTPFADSEEAFELNPIYHVPSRKPAGEGEMAFVDHQNDVTVSDIHLAHREGFESVEHLKRYTTTGMATDQGKMSNVNALAILAELRQQAIPQVGTTTFRPPYIPTTFGSMAGQSIGDLFHVTRKTPMWNWHVANGGVMEAMGDYLRPRAYVCTGESVRDAENREVRTVRQAVGLYDASTLGKIDVRGPDACKFLNLVYTNAWDNLAIGHCKYGMMLTERGMIIDDGITARLDESHYHMTTTSGQATGVLDRLEECLQVEWPHLDVHLTDVGEQWAVCALAGPMARDVLKKLTVSDMSRDAFPFMTTRAARVAGVDARIVRVSFTGELSYEINVPSRYGQFAWEQIMDVGAEFGIVPFGTEALHILRAERGFIVIGQDTDGSVTPRDLGMDWIVSAKKIDFIGKRGLASLEARSEGRRQLVGLLTENPDYVIPYGTHLVEKRHGKPPMKSVGFVCSTYYSETLGRSIAFALIVHGGKRMGQTLTACNINDETATVTVTEPMFLDSGGLRANS